VPTTEPQSELEELKARARELEEKLAARERELAEVRHLLNITRLLTLRVQPRIPSCKWTINSAFMERIEGVSQCRVP